MFTHGRPKNVLSEEHVTQVAKVYQEWELVTGLSVIVTQSEVAKNDYNLNPSRYVAQDGGEEVLPLEEAAILLKEAQEERDEADIQLRKVLQALGLVRPDE
jgi:type I restriction enzyme M protein